MSKILKEATVRRFMTLAKIGTLTDGFVNENWREDDMPLKATGVNEEDELEAELGAEDAVAGEEGTEIADLGADLGAEESAVSEEDVVDIVATIANALEQEYGIAVDVEGGADEMEAEVEMGADEMEAEVEMGGDMEADGDELDVEMIDDDEIVAEVLKRVTARLRESIKKNKKTRITRK